VPPSEEKDYRPKLKAAILPSAGIGDAVIFLQAAEVLKKGGYEVSIYHSSIKSLSPYLPSFTILKKDLLLTEKLFSYDLVFAQYDDSKETKDHLSIKNKHPRFHIFYPSYKKEKHGPLGPLDFASDPKLSLIKNLTSAMHGILTSKEKSSPLLDTKHLSHRKKIKQVIIHPFSNSKQKTWPLKKYLLLAKTLKKKGYSPLFIMKPEETNLFVTKEFPIRSSPNLSDLASLIHQSGFFIGNDSGPGHLASLLQIPSIIIADDYKRMKLWKPDYYPVKLITPAPWIPNLKWMRLRKRYWASYIPVSKVVREFNSISIEN